MSSNGPAFWLEQSQLQTLIDTFRDRDHRVIGPQVRDGAVIYADLAKASALPTGVLDEQDGGWYRLVEAAHAGPFDHVAGPHSLKNFLFPPRETIQRWRRQEGTWQQLAAESPVAPLAVIGPRACDLAALAIQDRVFLEGDFVDPFYKARREQLFVVAVNCRRAAATCFCHSMGCGPAVERGFDLLLTPVAERFLLEAGSAAGTAIATTLAPQLSPATADDVAQARQISTDLAAAMATRPPTPVRSNPAASLVANPAAAEPTAAPHASPPPRSLDTEDIRDLLFDNLEHNRWQEVAQRCLSCGNCTMVCPTCFCSSVTDVADLTGDDVSRERHWASCFTLEHGQMHGENARPTTAAQYRQWLTHKLAGWIDQFGSSGCTGCGRCITWCPVGIDLTEEVAAIRESAS